ncbi:MAG: hypothetical protein EA397_16600 [Deltaproteobacteria bacterium]|nr:MAG: hypothetical protein EA397_16600 [Deltaproteobacteria bacterium]
MSPPGRPRLRERLARLSRRAGIEIRRAQPPLDRTSEPDLHPLDALYQAGPRDVLLRVRLDRCLTFGLNSFLPTAEGASPFVRTLRWAAAIDDPRYVASPMAHYYSLHPASLATLYELQPGSNPSLESLPPIPTLWPWQAEPPTILAAARAAQVAADNAEHGQPFRLVDGDPLIGPLTPAKGSFELERLVALYRAIQTEGFRIDPQGQHNIRVQLLCRGEAWRVLVQDGGQHRLAVLGALGHEHAVVQVQRSAGLGGVISRRDHLRWPWVRAGTISAEDALTAFDRMFEGRQPAYLQTWCASAWG